MKKKVKRGRENVKREKESERVIQLLQKVLRRDLEVIACNLPLFVLDFAADLFQQVFTDITHVSNPSRERKLWNVALESTSHPKCNKILHVLIHRAVFAMQG